MKTFKEYCLTEAIDVSDLEGTPTGLKLMQIGHDILSKHGKRSGRDMLKEPLRQEFIDAVKKAKLKITKADIATLEDNNYHSEIEILTDEKMVSK